MNSILKNVLLVFLIINALFWGLFQHESHCRLVSYVTNDCPPHYIHLIIGIVCFVGAVYLKQYVN